MYEPFNELNSPEDYTSNFLFYFQILVNICYLVDESRTHQQLNRFNLFNQRCAINKPVRISVPCVFVVCNFAHLALVYVFWYCTTC